MTGAVLAMLPVAALYYVGDCDDGLEGIGRVQLRWLLSADTLSAIV